MRGSSDGAVGRAMRWLGAVWGIGWAALSFAAGDVCSLVTLDEMSAAIGAPASGGRLVSTDPATQTRSCPYQAGLLTILVAVRPFASAGEARSAYTKDLRSLLAQVGDEQRTTVEKGIGEAAYSVVTRVGLDSVGFTALRGSQQVLIAVVGEGASAVPRDRLRALMQKAVAR